VIEELKNRNWKALKDWYGDFNIFDLDKDFIIVDNEDEHPLQSFEMILCVIFVEYQKGLNEMLKSDDTIDNRRYQESLKKI